VLVASLVLNLAILFFFKYYNFFAGTLARFLAFHPPAFDVLLPVGISFYTFQALGYSIDVYRGTVRAERDFFNYALFVTFFPQLVAGPIERTGHLLPQFKVNHAFDYEQVTSGLKLAAWGMFKKVAIADQLAIYVNSVYAEPSVEPACALALGTIFFAIEIYCDFSGYSDIAIGSARALGFELMTNFRRPYFAGSIAEFWRRWHISLMTWLKDYVYIPLGGNRKGLPRQCLNILVVFGLSGLWHGAAWHFVAWGLLHGVYQIIGRTTMKWRTALRQRLGLRDGAVGTRVWQAAVVFILVCIGWIFFRAKSLPDAALILGKLVSLPGEFAGYMSQYGRLGFYETLGQMFQLSHSSALHPPAFGLFDSTALLYSLILTAVLMGVEIATRKTEGTVLVMRLPLVCRWAGYCAILMAVVMNWSKTVEQFIYFRF
jgi:D-alanyl-lipoteichoic acid acyltransferase DltB (MBOAT superfamily)